METSRCPPCSLVLQPCPEMTVDKQWEQTVTPTSIDLAPRTLPALANNATLIPPTLNLYESPPHHLLFLQGLTKMINDQPLLPSATTRCLTLAVRGTTLKESIE